MFGTSIALSIFVVAIPLSAPAADDQSAVAEIVQPFLKDKPHLGLVVGVTRESGHSVWGFGQVELEGKKTTPDAKTLFEIGSITKAFTGTLLVQSILVGKVKLDDPAQKHLPAGIELPKWHDREITLLHLATHTSGLPVQPPYLGLFMIKTKNPLEPYAEYDSKALGETLSKIRLTRPPGSQFEYSNLGAGILGHALAHANQLPNYESALANSILNPLQLVDTRVVLSPEQAKRLARGHKPDGTPASAWTFASLEACGGLRSNVHDLLGCIDAASGKNMTKIYPAFEMARQPWRETTRRGEHVGLGWFRQKSSAGDNFIVWHNGGTGGYRSFLAFSPKLRVGVVVLANADHSVDAIGMGIMKHLMEAK